MKYINHIDILGEKISFTIFTKKKFTNISGVIITIVITIISCVFFYIFGTDMINKTNPKINFINKINENYSLTELISKNFLIPFMFQDSYGKLVNVDGIIYPLFRYFESELSPIPGEGFINKRIIELNHSNCSLNYKGLIPGIENYQCLNIDDLNLTIGGDWSAEFVNYISIELYYCPNHGNYDPNGNCTSLDTLDALFGKWTYFAFFYPQLNFQNENLDNALTLEYKNFYYMLNMGINRADNLYFQKAVLYDDQNAFLSGNMTTETYYGNQFKTDYMYFPRDKFYSPETSTNFYSVNFFLGKNNDLYKRSFMKIQDLTAQLASFITILIIISRNLNSKISNFWMNVKIINELFDFYGSQKNFHQGRETSTILNKMHLSDVHLMRPVNNFIDSSLKPRILQIEVKAKNSEDKFNSKDSNVSKKLKFSFINYLKFVFSNKSFLINKKEIISAYDFGSKFISEKLDIISYLKTFCDSQNFKSLLLNENQLYSLEFLKKKNIFFDRNENENEKKNVIEYFKRKISEKNLDEIDNRILALLEDDFKSLIN